MRIQQDAFQAKSQTLWLRLSLIAPLYFGLISLAHGWGSNWVQDDARIHIVWLQRLVDPELFPNDLIAQYYQSIQAVGFKLFYAAFAKLGIAPLLLAKLLPTALALVATGYLFYLTLEFLPYPACGFWTTLFLNQNVWLKDDLISATPRAFVYPLLLAFLYYLARQKDLPMLLTVGLMALFYPQLALVELGVLALRLRTHRDLWLLLAAGLLVAITILPFRAAATQQFGALATAAQMQQMPEFGLGGRREYFGVTPVRFWLQGASGLRLPLFPPILWLSLALPWWLRREPKISANIQLLGQLLGQLLLSSAAAFLLAHLLFPALYLPSRYSFYSLRVTMATAAGIVMFLTLRSLWGRWSGLLQMLLGLLVALVIAVPAVPALFLPVQGWVQGEYPALYRWLASQPKTSLIASLSPEADNLPAFTQRLVLVSRELALAYHPAFYAAMQQRTIDLIGAHYSADLADLQAVLRQYGIDFLVLDAQFAQPEFLTEQDWLIHSSFGDIVSDQANLLKAGIKPALTQVIQPCTVFREKNLSILDAACISKIKSGDGKAISLS